jgi:acyl carrier protein
MRIIVGGIFLKTIMELLQETNKDADFAKSEDFVSDGLLDSMDVQMLAVAIEDEYGVHLAGTDLMPSNFVNIDAIRDMLRSHGVEGDI